MPEPVMPDPAVPDPAPIHITTRSGSVQVVAAEGAELEIVDGFSERHDDGSIHIRRAESSSAIEVRCAPGTDVSVGTNSGNVELGGPLGAVRVATISGKIRIADAARVDVRTKSGKIDIEVCRGECRILTKSSSVHVGSADRATVAVISGIVLLEQVRGAEVKTVSGKVLLGSKGGDRIAVRTVSGKVEIRVPAAAKPATHLRSLSGRVRCELPPGDDFEIDVASVSGAIQVSGG
jgi:DUF4097 and DUF4098 domain-containing protein YvlB